MCFGAEAAWIPAVLGGLVSAGGSLISHNEAQRNAQHEAQARMDALSRTTALNKRISDNSAAAMQQRLGDITGGEVQADQAKAASTRDATNESVITNPQDSAAAIPLSGDAPSVVKETVAKDMLDASNNSKAHAQAAANLGSYGDSWLQNGFKNADLASVLGTNNNFIQGNVGILPYQQDLAEYSAYRPQSPLGDILKGLGNGISGGYFAGKPTAPAVYNPGRSAFGV